MSASSPRSTRKVERLTYRLHGSTDLLQEWVKTISDDGYSDDNSDRVEVVHDIVGSTIESHTSRHGILHGTNTTIRQLENGDEEKDLTSLDGFSDLINESVIPVDFVGIDLTITFVNDRRPSRVPK